MKKVISSHKLEPINTKKIPLYQQIEFFTHWLYEINQAKTEESVPEEILSINDLIDLQKKFKTAQTMN